MKNRLLLKKVKEFKKYLGEFILFEKSGVEEVHALRVKSRELLSLVSKSEQFFAELKKIIKLSNKIRDMDVFLESYLGSLPKKYILKLDIKNIENSIKKKREKKLQELCRYLKSMVVPQSVEFETAIQNYRLKDKKMSTLNQKALHHYRIYIKKRLYNEKNLTPQNMERVNTLDKIKDLLGNINDNYNGLKRLHSLHVKSKLFKKIQKFTDKENLRIFKKFKKKESDV